MNSYHYILKKVLLKTAVLLLTICSANGLFAKYFVNNGGKITIIDNSVLTLKADFVNLSNGQISNSGNIYALNNWINNGLSGDYMSGDDGSVTFNGETTQDIGGANTTKFNKLFIQNDITLSNNIYIANELGFSTGLVELDTNNLVLESGAVISGASETGYVIAGNSGKLFMEVGNTDTEFPVGTNLSYTPLIINNSGDLDFFGVNVFNDVLENGTTGNTIPEADHCVNNTWNITEEIPGGSGLTLTARWNESLEGVNFNRNHCGIGHYTAGNWHPQTETAASGSDPYSVSRSGITELSAFAVGDTASPMSVTLRLHIDLTALLEGPFNGTDMNTGLNSAGLIPLNQPYNTSPWNYPGTESVAAIPNAGVVDWVLIELRDAPDSASATSAATVARKAAFILNDGSIVDTDGFSNLQFDISITQKLFAVVWHRNHLGIMSANNLIESDGVYSYNFSTGDNTVYGSDGQKQIAAGKWGMYGGNGDGNDTVNSSDYNIWSQKAGYEGYRKADFNLNGQVNNPDKDDIWIENAGAISKVPD
jgi:hypothetical protein